MRSIELVFGEMHWPGKAVKILRSDLLPTGAPAIQSTAAGQPRARKLKAKSD